MRTLAIHCNKGGVGKSTVAKHIATAADADGLNVLILDVDAQQNAFNWGKRRNRPPVVRFTVGDGVQTELERARNESFDLVVVDTPPGRSEEAYAAVEYSDLVLIPFWLERDAFDGVARSVSAARRMGKPACGILNFATPGSQTQVEVAKNSLEKLGVMMSPVVLHRYEIYRLVNPPGLTVQEKDPASTAAVEVAKLWNWLSKGDDT
jgi:chromosome partitioning protein